MIAIYDLDLTEVEQELKRVSLYLERGRTFRDLENETATLN